MHNLDSQLSEYQNALSTPSSPSASKVLGFGAVASSSLFAVDQIDAAVVAGPPPVSVPASSNLSLDIDGDGVTDFALGNRDEGFFIATELPNAGFGSGGRTQFFSYNIPIQGASGGTTTTAGGDRVIPAPAVIATGAGWMGWTSGGLSSDPWGVFGNAPGSVTGYIPVQFVAGEVGLTTGWIQIALRSDGSSTPAADGMGFTYLASAYTVPGSVPEPSTAVLVGLAAGALSLRRRRVSRVLG